MTAPDFTHPLCGCNGCPEWKRLVAARMTRDLSDEREWVWDIEGWERVIVHHRKRRVEYLAHVEEMAGSTNSGEVLLRSAA